MSTLTYGQARRVLDDALCAAEEIGCTVTVAVLDSGRELLAFGRQDGAPLLSAEIAQAKAFTARSLDTPTVDLGSLTQPGGPFYGLQSAHSRRLVTFAGGRPLRVGDVVVGAIGVAGGTNDQDDEIARAAQASLNPPAP
jgi:uncharacterized protein GlcG (DUF336 family)